MLLFVLYYVCKNICKILFLPFYHAKMQEWPKRTAQHFKRKQKSTAFKQQSYTRSILTHDPMLSCKVSKTGNFRQQTMSSLRIMLQFLGLHVQIDGMTSNGKYFQTHVHFGCHESKWINNVFTSNIPLKNREWCRGQDLGEISGGKSLR